MAKGTTRITTRIPDEDLDFVDALVDAGEFTNRTAVIRRALRDFISAYGPKMKAAMESRKESTEAMLSMAEIQAQIDQAQRAIDQLARK